MNTLHMFGSALVAFTVLTGTVLAQSDAMVEGHSSASVEVSSSLSTVTGKGVVGQAFILDGSQSQDDGVVRKYIWKQVSGPIAVVSNEDAVKASVVPTVAGTYVFQLSVSDETGKTVATQKHEFIVQYKESDLNFIQKPSTPPTPVKDSGEKGGTEDMTSGSGEIADVKIKNELKEEGAVAVSHEDGDLANAGAMQDWPKDGVSVDVGDVKGLTEEKKKERLEAVKNWAEVKSGQDLQNFAAGVLLKDAQIKGVKIKENLIEIKYKMPAKLFGFISMRYTAQISVNRGKDENWNFGSSSVKFPWYSFLLRKVTSAHELAQTVQQGGGPKVEARLSSYSSAAVTLEHLSSVLKTKHDTVKNSINNVR